jgi:hypothetical protein
MQASKISNFKIQTCKKFANDNKRTIRSDLALCFKTLG